MIHVELLLKSVFFYFYLTHTRLSKKDQTVEHSQLHKPDGVVLCLCVHGLLLHDYIKHVPNKWNCCCGLLASINQCKYDY